MMHTKSWNRMLTKWSHKPYKNAFDLSRVIESITLSFTTRRVERIFLARNYLIDDNIINLKPVSPISRWPNTQYNKHLLSESDVCVLS